MTIQQQIEMSLTYANMTKKELADRLGVAPSAFSQRLKTGKFKKDDEVYLILDKFLDKRIYDIKSNTTIINQYGLEGKYSIYLKINNTIYKTNTYITI